MHPLLADDLDRFPELLKAAYDRAVHDLDQLPDRPAAYLGDPPPLHSLPETGAGAEAALQEFVERWVPGLSGSAGSRYLGFVTGGVTPASLLGDWMTGVYDQNGGGGDRSTATALEQETLDWIRQLFGLSDAHQGALVSGATMSNTVGLAIAREWIGERRGIDVSQLGVAALGPVEVLSGSPHSSIVKAMSVLGLGRERIRRLPTLPGDREAVDVAALERELQAADGPVIVVANAGTVNTVDFDDLRAIAALKQRYDFWLHVDAAFGAFAALSPEHAHLTAGLDAADSVCVDLHKWLNVPYDSAVQFTRRRDLQVRVFHNSSPYLGLPGENPDYVHLTPENSRRTRAIAAWFTLAAYGREGHREIVERNIAAAQLLGRRLAEAPHLRLLAPTRLNVVCFTLAEDPSPERIGAALQAIAETGETFLTPTFFDGQSAIRAAFSNWRTTEADAERVAKVLIEQTR
jgi:glutamate/tyrosine decarboxylase-like PLP-dependent enzyme